MSTRAHDRGCPFCDGGSGDICDAHHDEFVFVMGRKFQKRYGDEQTTFAECLAQIVDGLTKPDPPVGA